MPQALLFLGDELADHPLRSGEAPTSFLQVRDSALVEAVAASFAEARDRLQADFGARLVVLVVPVLDRALARRGIRSIDAWSVLSSRGEVATLRTESHLRRRPPTPSSPIPSGRRGTEASRSGLAGRWGR